MGEREPLPDLLKRFGEDNCTKDVVLSFISAVIVGVNGLWPPNTPRGENISTGLWVSLAILFAGRLVKETIDISKKSRT